MDAQETGLVDEFTEETELDENKQHELLADEDRRIALKILVGRSARATLNDIATEVAARKSECDTSDAEIISDLEVVLHHIHLPKLDDFGVIEYDSNSRRVKF